MEKSKNRHFSCINKNSTLESTPPKSLYLTYGCSKNQQIRSTIFEKYFESIWYKKKSIFLDFFFNIFFVLQQKWVNRHKWNATLLKRNFAMRHNLWAVIVGNRQNKAVCDLNFVGSTKL